MSKIINRQYTILEILFYFHTGVIGATYTLYLLSKGFSLLEVSLLSGVFNVTSIIFEIPSGAFSDIVGRKKCALFSGVFLTAAMLIFLAFDNTILLVLAQIFWGVSYALESGNTESWAIENGKFNGREIDKLIAHVSKYQSVFSIIGSFGGVYLAKFSLDYIWILPVISAILFLIVSQTAMKSNFSQSIITSSINSIYRQYVNHIVLGFRFIYKDLKLAKIYILSIFVTIISTPLMIFWPVYLKETSLEKDFYSLSVVWVAIQLSIFLGSYILETYLNKFSRKKILASVTSLFFLSSISLIISRNYFFITSVIIVQECLFSILTGVNRGLMNENIEPRKRATLLSFSEVYNAIGKILSALVLSSIADNYGIQVAWSGSCIVCIIGIIFILKFKDLEGELCIE